MKKHVSGFLFTFAASACVSGCGGSAPEKAAALASTVPVKGKVMLKGKPMTTGSISFEPTDGGREAFGNIGADGSFTLTTFKADDGAIKGSHRVAVKAAGGGKKDPVPLKYQNYASSGIQVEVTEEKPELTIDLK